MNSKTIEIGPERWARVEEYFAAAADLDAAERDEYLDSVCGDDQELREYVYALLDADPDIEDKVEATIIDAIGKAFADDEQEAEELKGQMIGPYRVERLLGSGGMGMVYLATRADDQFEQQVAIKLGRHRLVDPQTVQRLKAERQILADLDHPNIARLFDGGTTDDGVPYLVMEYIDGIRIDNYCDQNQLGVAERLELFRTICGAVHYAHQNLVIHRDIKASNILVTADGTPKLLDFGIAKLTDEQGAAAAGLTREGAVIMTPENAAPEQLLGKSITTATDTYALGLLLYLILSGFRAHATQELAPSELARIVCKVDPVRPSHRIAQAYAAAREQGEHSLAHEIEGIAADRRTTVDRLRRRLHGDIDTIILNALRKEPERRYSAVNALANDIGLHLDAMPIAARSDSWRYRTGKFIRRHYAGVAASVIAFAVLVGFSVVLSIQNQHITMQRDTAREVSQFLEDIFMTPDPAQARGAQVTAEEILAVGASRIRNDLEGRPEIQATLMGTIGRVYFNLGEYDPSIEMLEDALYLLQRSDPVDDVAVAAAKNDLAETLLRIAEYRRARELLEGALATNLRLSDGPSASVAINQLNLAEISLATGDMDNAEQYANLSIEGYRALGEGYSLELSEAMGFLARAMQVRGDLDRTEELIRGALEIVSASEGPDHPVIGYYLQNLGVLQRSKGDLEGAEETFARAIDHARRILGEDHDLLAALLVDQGTLLHAKGDFERAETSIREALTLDTAVFGRDHPRVGYDLTILGMLLHDMHEINGAEDSLLRALDIFEFALGDSHQYTASALTELGAVLNTADRLDEAQAYLEQALAIRLNDYPPGHELVAATRTEYADNLARRGDFDAAGPMLMESVAALEDKSGRRKQRANRALARYHELSGDQGNE